MSLGEWASFDGQIAAFQDGAWAFYAPVEGWLAWVDDEDVLIAFDGSAWVPAVAATASVSLNPAAGGLVGINTTADTTNRLSVSSPASLFNHEGAGHQVKVNKNTSADTASLLFQTGFSGRAEFGLTGDDDWRVKVSADGSVWREVLVADRATGRVRFPSGGVRDQLTANRSYYVRTDGNDANDGLSNAVGGAFLTIQRALDIVGGLDLGVFTATIYVNDGAYTITSALRYRGFQGGQVVLRALNDPTTTPDALTLTGTKATDEATVRGAHKVIVQASTAINLIFHDSGGAIGSVRGIAFIQTGAHTTYVYNQSSAPAMALNRCTFFAGGGAIVSQSRAFFENCLIAHSGLYGLYAVAAGNLGARLVRMAYTTQYPLFAQGASAAELFNCVMQPANAAHWAAAYIDRASWAYLFACTFRTGTNSVGVDSSEARIESCTFDGPTSRLVYATNGARVSVVGGSIVSGATLVYAERRSSVRVLTAPSGSPTYSPALGTIGNNEGYIS